MCISCVYTLAFYVMDILHIIYAYIVLLLLILHIIILFAL